MENIDIKQSVQDLLDQTKTSLLTLVTEDTPEVLEAVNSYIANAETRFSDLLTNMAGGGDVKFLLDRVSEEKDILLSEVLSFEVIAKGAAQTIINSVQDIILKAIAKVLPTGL